MQLPIQLDPTGKRSLQEQLFEQFVLLVSDGRLKRGMRMPATRQLALDLAVSRNTVVLAYERLVAEGLLVMRPPLGAFVSEHAADLLPASRGIARKPEPVSPQPLRDCSHNRFEGSLHSLRSPFGDTLEFDFWVGRPDPRLFPVQSWRKLVEQSLASMRHGDGSYGDPAGLASLREAVAVHLGVTRGVACAAGDVIITNGIQEGINIAARLLLDAGMTVGMECPGYLGAANVFASYGARLLPLDVDDLGAAPTTLSPDCRLVYLTPAHQYPSGVAMSPARRHAWLQWASERGAYLIEDDYDSDFYYDGAPLPAVKSADRTDCVIYLGTFSKSLAAGLRVGYMLVPAQLLSAAAAVKGLLTNGSPWLVQAALAAFLASGEYTHHLRRLRKLYAARRDALCEALRHSFGEVRLSGGQAGMHMLWLAPPEHPVATEVERLARSLGVGIYSLASGNAWLDDPRAHPRWQRALMLGYAAMDEHEIATGIARLAQALQPRSSPEHAREPDPG